MIVNVNIQSDCIELISFCFGQKLSGRASIVPGFIEIHPLQHFKQVRVAMIPEGFNI